MAYFLDADVFIQAKNRHYGFDFCPAFWDWLVVANGEERVFSIERVGGELRAGNDQLAEWAGERGDGFFLKPDDRMVPALREVALWARDQDYEPAAVSTFLEDADYYLVAQALALDAVVVTHEVFAATTKKIKIPNACLGVRVTFTTPFDMLRRERVQFVLGDER